MRIATRRAFISGAAMTAGGVNLLRAEPQDRAFAASAENKDLRKSQLFLDDTWIEESYRLERVWERADIFPEPVLRPEMPWEGHQLVMFGSVFHDASGWRMYYMTYNRPAPSLCCLAYSSDGLHWERPKLGLFAFNGSKANNIVFAPRPGQSHDGPTVCHDSADPKAPYKMMYYSYGEGVAAGEYVGFSRDGIVWEHHLEPVMVSGDRTNVMGSRDHRGKFVAYLRHRDMMRLHRARTVWRVESSDFLHWSEPEVILRADLLDDPNTELYGMSGFPYSDMYLGLLERWYDNPDVIELQLAWSHDGRDWHRPGKRSAFVGPSLPWNRRWNSAANTAPVNRGSQLWFYFGGRSEAHGSDMPPSYGAIGLASHGIDRFAAIQADFKEGLLVTRPMRWPGGDLALNCTNTRYRRAHPSSGGGSISVELRDEANHPIAGFSGTDRADVSWVSTGDRLRPVRFGQQRSMNDLAGRRVRLAIALSDARVYAFRSLG